jgi:hypothetical protein
MTALFHDRLEELRTQTGCDQGKLEGQVEVDQVYAHYQHERLDLHHPRGGQARYLIEPLYAGTRRWVSEIAADFLDDGGHRAMRNWMEDLAEDGGVATHAPVEFDDLRRSGHPTVRLGARIIYDRAPRQHRLTAGELRIKARLRKLPPEIIGWIWWHVMHNQKPPPHLGGR